jgi:hypothetical protein
MKAVLDTVSLDLGFGLKMTRGSAGVGKRNSAGFYTGILRYGLAIDDIAK